MSEIVGEYIIRFQYGGILWKTLERSDVPLDDAFREELYSIFMQIYLSPL